MVEVEAVGSSSSWGPAKVGQQQQVVVVELREWGRLAWPRGW
jgi:hypothetical protein